MPRSARFPLLLCLAWAACAPIPDLGQPAAPVGPVPQILPLDQVLAMGQTGQIAPDAAAALTARAQWLRARAAAMQGPVQDPATRARLAAAMAQGSGG